MRKACLVVVPPYTRGEIFNRQNKILNRDDCLLFFHEIQDEFKRNGIDLNTQDINSPQDCEIVIYNEMPKVLPKGSEIEKSYLLLLENELIRPDNWNLEFHKSFKKIFTWNDDFVDNKKYFKINPTYFGRIEFVAFKEKKALCTLIAGNKRMSHPQELYSERIKAIRWFEKNHPQDFEFYGLGWDQYTFQGPMIVRALNRIPLLRKILASKWPTYRGPVKNKLAVFRQYKFSICYENAHGIMGYISEKIFDSLAAGCIPVYWGAPNILDFVPEDCFIDKRKFETYEALYDFMANMTEEEYNRRVSAIKSYLSSPLHELFLPRPVAKTLSAIAIDLT
jgi:alpha(1,3/1,4) fucosyltransferase